MIAADVHTLLERYEPADARESGFRARMLQLAGASASPFERTTFAPGHFTASAFVLSPDRDALVMIFHKKLKLWLQPGGHIERSDDSVVAAARREVAEETSLSNLSLDGAGLFDIDVHPIPAHGVELAHEHFDLRVLFVAAGSPGRGTQLSANDEVEGVKWVPLAEIAELTTDESVQRAVRKLLAREGRGAR